MMTVWGMYKSGTMMMCPGWLRLWGEGNWCPCLADREMPSDARDRVRTDKVVVLTGECTNTTQHCIYLGKTLNTRGWSMHLPGCPTPPYMITSTPKLNLFNKFQTMTTSRSNSQPTTTSTMIYALLRRWCSGREEDHRAEDADSGE
jgi:hypothetical protein